MPPDSDETHLEDDYYALLNLGKNVTRYFIIFMTILLYFFPFRLHLFVQLTFAVVTYLRHSSTFIEINLELFYMIKT